MLRLACEDDAITTVSIRSAQRFDDYPRRFHIRMYCQTLLENDESVVFGFAYFDNSITPPNLFRNRRDIEPGHLT